MTVGEPEERSESGEAERESAFSPEEMLEELMVYDREQPEYAGPTLAEEQEPQEEDLERNAAGPRYMTLGAFMAGSEYIANAEQAMPSPIRMMAAMTLQFTGRAAR